MLAVTLSVTACHMTRQGPPAPVVDRSGIYFTAPAGDTPPVTPAPRASISVAPLVTSGTGTANQVSAAPSGRRGSITSVPLDPAAPVSGSPVARTAPPKPAPRQSAALPPEQGQSVVRQSGNDGEPTRTETRAVTRQGGGRVTVRAGETLYAISRRENVPLRALIDANRLRPPYALRTGQVLSVPSVRVYVVAAGDTVSAVARRHEVSVSEVIRQNDLKAPDYGVYVGQRLVLPWQAGGDSEIRNPRLPQDEVRNPASPPAAAVVSREPNPPPPRVELADPDGPPPKRAASKFMWPVRGKVVSGFGAKGGGLYNDGINIAAPDGDIVRAAENGIVAYAGNELRGYGNLLLVRHADGWVSAYAHNGELLVRRGQVVKRGQPIAKVGRSGAVSQPQLHFELRRGRKAVDPKPHLS